MWGLAQDRVYPPPHRQPWFKPATLGGATPWGQCAQRLAQWEGPGGSEAALSHGLGRSWLLGSRGHPGRL